MLSVRLFQLLAVGLCLLLVAKYMELMQVTVRGLDRLMMRRFFDVDGLTSEIRARMERNRRDSPAGPSSWTLVCRAAYRWLCRRLRRVANLDPGAD